MIWWNSRFPFWDYYFLFPLLCSPFYFLTFFVCPFLAFWYLNSSITCDNAAMKKKKNKQQQNGYFSQVFWLSQLECDWERFWSKMFRYTFLFTTPTDFILHVIVSERKLFFFFFCVHSVQCYLQFMYVFTLSILVHYFKWILYIFVCIRMKTVLTLRPEFCVGSK